MILVLRALGVGDLATAVPALRGLRAAFPGETLSLAAPARLTPLILSVGAVDRIVPAAELEPLDAAPDRPRLAVNLHGSGPESHRRLQALHPGELWAFASRAAGHHDGPGWLDDEHEVRRWCRLIRYYGVACDESDLDLLVPAADVPAGVTIIHPGAESAARRWPPDRFASVARRLVTAGHQVLVTGSQQEHDLCVRVTALAGLPASAAPCTGLTELAALVAAARLVICGDTGIAHLATAYRTPSVVLFGPVSPARCGPPADRPYHRPLWHGTHSARGDLPGPVHPALLTITPEEVLTATTKALQDHRPSPTAVSPPS
ncbi:glycosyltransferase family 9 protein [Actinoplanes sp. NPDC026670]|uniref:glycosyltransferase family 9 protein n=1 Tax=Actinoplanes sp. NPDC026670 TaxID=3154700 RepID=UPI0033CA1546